MENTTNTTITTTATVIASLADAREKLASLSLSEIVDRLNQIRNTPEESHISIYLQERVAEQNESNRAAAIAEIVGDGDKSALWARLLDSEFTYPTYRISHPQDKDYSLKDGEKYLSFSDIEKAYKKLKGDNVSIARDSYENTAVLFRHNVMGEKAETLKDGKVAIPVGSAKLIVKDYECEHTAKRFGLKSNTIPFSKCSNGALYEQALALVDCLVPDEFKIILNKSDVRAIADAVLTCKMRTYKAGKIDAVMTETLYAAICTTKGKGISFKVSKSDPYYQH